MQPAPLRDLSFPAPLRKNLRSLPRALLACAVPALLCFPGLAAADALTAIANEYRAASAGWMSASLVYALRLFYLLLGIELAVSAIGYLFYKENLADFFAALLVKLLALLFFWVLLEEAPVWIPAIINSFTEAGAAIGGTTVLDPSSVFGQGMAVATAMLASINDASVFNSFLLIVIAGLSALGVVLAYAVIAAQLLVTLVESYLVIGGGALMLGFAGSRWTLTFTERYLGYAVSVGIKLFVLYLIIGLGGTLAVQWAAIFTAAQGTALPQPQAYLDVVGGALVFMFVGWQVPALASSLMMGSPSLTFGGAATTTALLTAAMANAVTRSLATTASSARQGKEALQSAATLTKAATVSPGETRSGGMGFADAAGKTAGDIRAAASREFRGGVSGGRAPGSAADALREQKGIKDKKGGERAAGRETRPVRRVIPPPLPPDHGHGGVSIRFDLPE